MCYYSVERLLNESTNTSALSSQYAWLYAAVDWIEVILSLFSALFVGIGLYIFYYCPIFNRNLISIGYTLGLNFYGILLSRLAVIFLLMSKKRSASSLIHFLNCNLEVQLFEYARMGFISSYFVSLISLTVERFIATVQLTTYERRKSFRFVSFSIAIQIFAFFYGFFVLFYNKIRLEHVISCTAVLSYIIFVFFAITEKINLRWYKTAQSASVGIYTLSERFQLSENVRTSKVLKESMILCFTWNIVCHLAVFVVVFSKDILVRQVGIMIFNFAIIFYAISIIGVILLRVAAYKKKLIQLFHTIRCLNTVRSQEPLPGVLVDLVGNPMIFNANDETILHFNDLHKQWS